LIFKNPPNSVVVEPVESEEAEHLLNPLYDAQDIPDNT
jgi:hypothetical protein